MAAAVLLVLLAFAAPRASTVAAAEPLADLCPRLQQRAAEPGVLVGFVFMDFRDGTRCVAHGTEPFPTASLYKLLVMAEAYHQLENGTFSLDEAIVIEPRHFVDDAPGFRPEAGYAVSAQEALRQMITISHNASAFALRERLGASVVAETPARLGMDGTSLGADFVTTAEDMAKFFTWLYAGMFAEDPLRGEMLALLAQQEIDDRIPAALPEGVPVAHKTGDVDEYVHDAGIVFAPGGNYVMVVLTRWQTSPQQSLDVIHDLAAMSYQAFEQQPPSLPAPPPPPVPRIAPATEIVAAPAGGRWWDVTRQPEAAVAALGALAALLVAAPAVMLARRRRAAAAYQAAARGPVSAAPGSGAAPARIRPAPAPIAPAPASPTQYARVATPFLTPARSSEQMRLGSRSRNSDHEQAPPPLPASAGASIPTLGSERLQRVARYFDDQADLLDQMREQVEQALVPLSELLIRQRETTQRMLENLEERLRPLNEYADGEAANLHALEQRLDGDGKEYVWRSFQDYMAQQRERVEETRRRIDEQRRPLIEHDADQRATLEVALSRFDKDLDALEENLVDQRRVMMRMLDAMRSDSFLAVKDFLASREAAFEEAVQAHVTDPAELGARLKELTLSLRQAAGDDPHLGAVLSSSNASDERLGAAGHARPRALASSHEPPQTGRASGAEANAERSA